MTKQNPSPKRTSKQQYSVGSLIAMILLVLVYWWITGSLPGSEDTPSSDPVANAPEIAAVATNTESIDADSVATESAAQEPVPTEVPTTVDESPSDSEGDEPSNETDDTAVVDAEAAESAEPTEVEPSAEVALPTETSTLAPTATPTPLPTPTATKPPEPTATPANPARAGPPGIPAINYDELPREALETIILIAEGGPFPFDRDGITFQNREGLLPDKPRGYYSEYTVITPGASTRGARRIVAGEEGELYYTDDHYESFSWVVLP